MTLFTKRSLISGRTSSREIAITQEEYDQWLGTNTPVQRAFPNLSPDDREFLISGVTPEEWEEAFGDDEEPMEEGKGEEEAPDAQKLN